MQRRFKKDPKEDINDYVGMVIENISLGNLTTEQVAREMTIFSLTLLRATPKAMAGGV